METYICKKCGDELILDDVMNWTELSCPSCDEPIPQEELMKTGRRIYETNYRPEG